MESFSLFCLDNSCTQSMSTYYLLVWLECFETGLSV